MKTFLAIALAGCGVSSVPTGPDGIDPPQAPTSANIAPTRGITKDSPLHLAGYRIEALPTLAPGNSQAAKAICATGGVVGTTAVASNQYHAVLYANGVLTDLGTLGGTGSSALDGNAAGTIVGNSAAPNFGRAFVYRDGAMTELSGIGGEYSNAYAVNDREEIVGQASIPGEGDVDEHAILWEPDCSNAVDLTALNGGRYGWARDINDQGDIVGTDADPVANHSRAVMWHNRVLVELDDGGAPDSLATAINDAGAITGIVMQPGMRHAVVWRDGTMTDLGTLGGSYSDAIGIDNAGDVVGDAATPANDRLYAVVFAGGAVINLNDYVDSTHWSLGQATDICDDGRIVGNGILDGASRGFILTPE